MACPRSVNSWDIIVTKDSNGNIFLDKRQDSRIDYLSVNENWNEISQSDKESPNHHLNLSNEATFINHIFSQQVLSKSPDSTLAFDHPNPFLDSVSKGNQAASVGYRYRRFALPDNTSLVVRCELNGYTVRKDETLYLTIKALNEFDSKLSGNVDWRQKLESQTAAVLATEMKNNSNKLARWTAQAILSGSHELKLGFVSRLHSKDSYRHVILLTQRYNPKSFASTHNISIINMWGTLRVLIEKFRKLEEGTYILIKDPNKAILHLYRSPSNVFATELNAASSSSVAPPAAETSVPGGASIPPPLS